MDALGEVAHEGQSADALGEPRDLAEAHHEAVLLAELVQGPALALVVIDELHFVLCGDEALQELQEVQAQSSLVVPVGAQQMEIFSVLQSCHGRGRTSCFFWYVRLDRAADVRSSHAFLAQGDGQVFGSVGLHQRNFAGGLLGLFHLEGAEVDGGGLGLGFKLLLENGHVELLRRRNMKTDTDAGGSCVSFRAVKRGHFFC